MNRRRLGFTIYEILIALSIFVIVMGMAAQLFRAVFTSVAADRQLNTQNGRIDSAIARLSTDAWGCSAMTADSHSVILSQAGGSKVNWTISADGTVQRADANGRTVQWPSIGSNWTFASDGPALVISDRSSQGPQAVRLVSQVLLSRRTP